MACCIECEFYCTVPPNAGKCNVKLTYVSSQYSCANFTRKIDRSAVTFTPCHTYSDLMRSLDEFLTGLDRFSAVAAGKTVDALVTEAKRRYDEEQSKTCFSCGLPLKIDIRGSRKYCSRCGCYLPEIVYGSHFQSFTESVKPINPMKIPKPPPMPTIHTH